MEARAEEGTLGFHWAGLCQRETALRHQPLVLFQEASTLHMNVSSKGKKTLVIPASFKVLMAALLSA